jgi:hypothetical protein
MMARQNEQRSRDRDIPSADELAEFIWSSEYDSEEYPWSRTTGDERAYYIACAQALLGGFFISWRASS